MNNTTKTTPNYDTGSEITYHNKDVTAKLLTEGLKGKTLNVYGLPALEIVDILPTNLPAIEANELRIDNLLLFSDGSIGIIDYQSTYTWADKVKHVNYIARILARFQRQGILGDVKNIRLIIIFTADIDKADTLVIDVGCMKVYIEPAYLIGTDTKEVWNRLNANVGRKGILTDEELMELIILPLTVKGTAKKQDLAADVIGLANKLVDEKQRTYALAGILTFSDKFINKDFAKKVRENIMTLKVVQYLIDESKNEGKIEGKIEGKNEGRIESLVGIIRRNSQKQHTPSAISEFLGIPLSETELICALLNDNPDSTDLQIAEIFLNVNNSLECV